jgi:Novel STAND NTPase 1
VSSPDAGPRGILDDQHPWPGLASFEESDRDFFCGRETEAEALGRLIGRARLTVLFGKSGLGKTSLLQAGLFPRLRQDAMLPVRIRLDFSPGAGTLRAQILGAVGRASRAATVEAPAMDEAASLWENFHRRDADFWNERQRLVTPVLVLDQFEETFTLGREKMPDACRVFLDELSDLVEGRPAPSLKERLEKNVGEADRFTFDRHAYKVVLSLREDFLAELEGLRDRMPSIVNNRFRLRAMRGLAALEVVRVPGRRLIESDVAERIVRFVARAEKADAPLAELQLEPALLSLFCRELNAKRLERGLDRITDELLRGSQTGIIGEFYTRCLKDLGRPVRAFVEEQLVTESGYRDTVALERAIATPGVSLAAIDRLIERRLLRSQELDGVRRIELTHDVLVDVVRGSRDERRAQASARRRSIVVAAVASLVLVAAAVWLVRDHRNHARQSEADAAVFAAVLGEMPDSAQSLLNSARKSWDSAAARGLDPSSRAKAAAQTVEVARDDMTRETIQRLTRQLNDDSVATRKSALADLFAYIASPVAVAEALSWIEPPRAETLSNAGRINVLTFLRNTRPPAWTRDQLARARTAVRAIDVPGPQTRDLQSRVLEEFDTIELNLITLYIQFAPEQGRAFIQTLRDRLLETGLNVPAIDLETGDYRNEIRYFLAADSAISVIVANRVERILADDGRRLDLRVVRPRSPNAREGRIELWIHVPGPGKE